MRRITFKQQQTINKFHLSPFQFGLYDSLLKFQKEHPQLTEPQYNLFKQLYKQIQKNEQIRWLKTKP